MVSAVRKAPAKAITLQDIANVGRATAADLRALGIHEPLRAQGEDPYALYDRLNRVTGLRHDPCVLDAFIAAMRSVEGRSPKRWWAFSAERKRGLAKPPKKPSR